MKKILIIRFSSIGDIVLTTPIIRCAKLQLSDTEVHFVTRESFRQIVVNNIYIDKIYTFKSDISELFEQLKAERYDVVIDLHKNLRSYRLKQRLKIKEFTFDKLNLKKFLAVNLKMLSLLPPLHIVDRYFEGIKELGIKNDNKGLDYFISEDDRIHPARLFFNDEVRKYIVLVVGGSYYTKKIPLNKLKEIATNSKLPLILLGGKEDKLIGDELKKDFPEIINTCGNLTINQSASVIQQADWVITSDTGMMHIAAAFSKKIISVWDNTIPEFGMSPYMPQPENKILEINYLSCRPCSKLGYKRCPRGHFKCMNDINYSFIQEL